jgi:two-component system sensor histidine kinase KdpD
VFRGRLRIHPGAAPGAGDPRPRLPHPPARRRLVPLSPRRRLIGWSVAFGATPLAAAALATVRTGLGGAGGLPELLVVVVVAALAGGLLPALAAAVIAVVAADWLLVPPLHSLTVGRPGDLAALLSFLFVAALVSGVIDRLTRRRVETARARAESEALARLAGGAVLSPAEALPTIVDQLRSSFGLDAVAVLDPLPGGGWTVVAAAGAPVPGRPDGAAFSVELAEGSVLVLNGERSRHDDHLLDAFVAQLRAVQHQQRRQRETAATVTGLEAANDLRTTLLAAVSHDLRTPLASIKASATSLLSSEVDWDPDARRVFAETIDLEADRLGRLITNLLDMSRLQSGGLRLELRPVQLDEVVHAALASLSGDTATVGVDLPETLPPVLADPALLERSVANLLANAMAWSPAGHGVWVRAHEPAPASRRAGDSAVIGTARPAGGRLPAAPSEPVDVQLCVVDTGPGIPVAERDRMLRPFQRLDGRPGPPTGGVGLGLAVASGFVDLMGGRLALSDTPGGGLTAIITLPAATPAATPAVTAAVADAAADAR